MLSKTVDLDQYNNKEKIGPTSPNGKHSIQKFISTQLRYESPTFIGFYHIFLYIKMMIFMSII